MIGNQVFVQLRDLACYSCTTHFAMDEALYRQRLADGKSFWCPNGHSQCFTESEVDKLKKANQNLKARATYAERTADRRAEELEQTKRSRAAIKGQLTRTRNRIAHGVCPCCNRSFANVAKHMSGQHPEFKEAVKQ